MPAPPPPSLSDDRLSNTDPALRRCWHPVALSTDVVAGAPPLPVRLLGEGWRVARSPVGELSATAEPAGLVDHEGLVFLAPDDPVTELLVVEEAHDPAFRTGWLRPVRAAVGAGLMVDNFLDMAHFPFVHAATIGAAESERVHDMVIERLPGTAGGGPGLGMTVTAEHPFPHHEDPGVAAGIRPLLQRRRLTYLYRAPFSVGLRIEYLDAGGTNTITFHVQPEDDDGCRLYAAIHRDDLVDDDAATADEQMAEAVAYEEAIVAEDLALQEQYVDRRLPLDLRVEVHVAADRSTVELRRILRDLRDAHPG